MVNMTEFGNWQSFLDDYLSDLRQDSKSYEYFRSLKCDEYRIAFVDRLSSGKQWHWINKYFENVHHAGSFKSPTVAAELRNNGNKQFQKKCFSAALDLYNQSVMYAPQSSDCIELALSIANRSAVFFHTFQYQDCLNDITLATKLNYPSELCYKLSMRAGQCHFHLGHNDKALQAFIEAEDQLKVVVSVDDRKHLSLLAEISRWRNKLQQNKDIKPPDGSISLPEPANTVLTHASNAVSLPEPANTVLTHASTAVSLPEPANTVLTHASTAVSLPEPANTVLTRASNAVSLPEPANTVLTRASNAVSLPEPANTVLTRASNAVSLPEPANTVLTRASTAVSLPEPANTVLTRASTAVSLPEPANTVLTHASNAVSLPEPANTVLTHASNAVSLTEPANTVLTHASTAVSLPEPANTVLTRASTAVSLPEPANTVLTHASNAVSLPEPANTVLTHASNAVSLTEPANTVLTHASNAVELRFTADKGRHLVAVNPISAGDVLIVERPYAAVLLPTHYSQRCHHCLHCLHSVTPCTDCTIVRYCSETCRKESWDRYHSVECKYLLLLHAIGVAHLSLRIVLMTQLNFLLQMRDTHTATAGTEAGTKSGPLTEAGTTGPIIAGQTADGKYECNYLSVYHLMPHTEHMQTDDLIQYTLTAYLLLMVLDRTGHFTEQTDTSARLYVGGLLLRHICQLVCNAHAITELQRTESTLPNIDINNQVRVATAIYPTASLMNHACQPTIISSFVNETLIVRAVRDVDAGAEIYNCYGPHVNHMSRTERQQHLSEQYFFDCNCEVCNKELEQELGNCALLCRHCAGAVNNANGVYKCVECHREPKDLSAILAAVKQSNDLWSAGLTLLQQHNVNAALLTLQECLKVRQHTLFQFNKDLAQVQDAVAQCYAIKGDYMSASCFLRETLKRTETVFGPTSIELANELLKYSEVCVNAQQTNEAQTAAQKALQLFTLHYGPQCEAVTDLQTLLNSLHC